MNINVESLTKYTPGDPILIKDIVTQLKLQGVFDQFRKECISDVDTKPAYQNLCHRVDGHVSDYLSKVKWRSHLNKNQLRENIRKHVNECNFVDPGISRIVDQLVNPRINTVLVPKVEDIVSKYIGKNCEEKLDKGTEKLIKSDEENYSVPDKSERLDKNDVKNKDELKISKKFKSKDERKEKEQKVFSYDSKQVKDEDKLKSKQKNDDLKCDGKNKNDTKSEFDKSEKELKNKATFRETESSVNKKKKKESYDLKKSKIQSILDDKKEKDPELLSTSHHRITETNNLVPKENHSNKFDDEPSNSNRLSISSSKSDKEKMSNIAESTELLSSSFSHQTNKSKYNSNKCEDESSPSYHLTTINSTKNDTGSHHLNIKYDQKSNSSSVDNSPVFNDVSVCLTKIDVSQKRKLSGKSNIDQIPKNKIVKRKDYFTNSYYDVSDLYKPRPSFSLTSRRHRNSCDTIK